MDASQRSRAVSGDSLFSGSTEAEQRASQFTDSIPMVGKPDDAPDPRSRPKSDDTPR
jgi:hypothetical protein